MAEGARNTSELPPSRWRLGLLAGALGSTVFLFAAGQIRIGNADEFTTSFAVLLAAGLAASAAMVLLGVCLRRLMSDRVAARAEALFAALTVLAWLQGTFLLWDYGALDGRQIPWGDMAGLGAIDATLWLAGLLFGLYGGLRFGKLLVGAAVAVVAVQAAALAGAWVQAPGVDTPEPVPASAQAMFEFSPERNVLHIVLDGFQSDIFRDIVAGDRIPEIGDALEGFTFFENHIGSFPYTQLSMPAIVSGEVYQNDSTVSDFTDRVMRGPTVLNAALAAGYEVDIAAQPSIRSVYAQSGHTHAYTIPGNLHATRTDYFSEDVLRLADLALFRVAPHFVRYLIHQDELWLLQRLSQSGSYPGLRYFAEIEFLRRFGKEMTATRPAPVYKLFHLMISHRPTVGTANCDYDGVQRTSRDSVTEQSICGLRNVIAVLDRMRALDLYDDALIVLMADHGAWVRPQGFARSGAGPNAAVVSLAVPLLAVKPPGASGRLAASTAPSQITDVARTIADLAGFDADLLGRNVYDLRADSSSTRYYYDYAYGDNAKMKGYLHTMLEYRIDGSPFDRASWSMNRRLLPGGRTEAIRPD